MELSVIIPAYNEQERLPRSILNTCQYFDNKNIEYEVLVIDDGSTDKTADFVMSLGDRPDSCVSLKRNERNFGKGYSVKKGVLLSKGKYILVTDSDQSTPIEYFDKLMEGINQGYDIVIGSRALKGSNIAVHQLRHREFMGKFFNCLVRFFTGLPFKDTQCGFKLFKQDTAKQVFKKQRINGFAFDVEVLVLARKSGAKILECPIEWRNDPSSKVGIFKHPLEMFFDLLRISFSSNAYNKNK